METSVWRCPKQQVMLPFLLLLKPRCVCAPQRRSSLQAGLEPLLSSTACCLQVVGARGAHA